MKIIYKVATLLILLGLFISCSNEELIDNYAPYQIYINIENENGEDITSTINESLIETWNNDEELPTVIKYYSEQEWYYYCPQIGYKYEVENPIHCAFDVMPAYTPNPKIIMRLFEDDKEDLILTAKFTEINKYSILIWEYNNTEIPYTSRLQTYVRFIRHDDGTYTLKE